MVLHISVLFSEVRDRDFVVILTNKKAKTSHDVLLEEFRNRGFKRCCQCTYPSASSVALFDPETKSRTIEKTINTRRIKEDSYYQAMYFETTWNSETMGLELQGHRTPSSPHQHPFCPTKELAEDVKQRDWHYEAVGQDENDASISGYGSSAMSGHENLGAASKSSSADQGKAMAGKDLVEEVLSVAALQLTTGPDEPETAEHRSTQAWLKSLSTPSSLIPETLPTEDLDRELGNLVEATVGPEGREIPIRSYHVSIPPNAVKAKTQFKFRVSLEIDLLDYPQDLMPISLPLYCSPGDLEFEEKITIRLATWLRRDGLSQNSGRIPALVFTQRKGQDWECVESTELTSSGYVEFKCAHFCVNAAFVKKSDAHKGRFAIEHILFRNEHGAYTSCHFLASDPFVDAMFRHIKQNYNYKIIHPPTYKSLVRPGDEIRVALESKNSESYRFESEDSCVLKICEEFYAMNRRESFSFLITPKPDPNNTVEFVYVIGEKRFLIRDQLKEISGDTANFIVKGGIAHFNQDRVNFEIEKRQNECGDSSTEPKIPRRALGGERPEQTVLVGTEESVFAEREEHGRSTPPCLQEPQETQEGADEDETAVKELFGD